MCCHPLGQGSKDLEHTQQLSQRQHFGSGEKTLDPSYSNTQGKRQTDVDTEMHLVPRITDRCGDGLEPHTALKRNVCGYGYTPAHRHDSQTLIHRAHIYRQTH